MDGNLSCYNLCLFCQFIKIFKVFFICHNELKLTFWVYTDTLGRFTYVFLFFWHHESDTTKMNLYAAIKE